MKRKEIDNKVKVNGYYVNEFIRGFWGEQDEGNWMLCKMGLQPDVVPFSVVTFFQNKRACWKDKDGNTASISFKSKPTQLECFGSYLKKRKNIRIFREWGCHENPEVIARLESEAIGDLCMKCIYENLIV